MVAKLRVVTSGVVAILLLTMVFGGLSCGTGEKVLSEVPEGWTKVQDVSLDNGVSGAKYECQGSVEEGQDAFCKAMEDDGWVIVDYKTDAVSAENLETRFQTYRNQGKWYARAVEKASGHAGKEVNFFFVRPGKLRVLTDFA